MKKLILIFSLLTIPASALAQDEEVPQGFFFSTNCFSGDAIDLKANHRFETMRWSDVELNVYPLEPVMYYVGERGAFSVSNDTLRLDYQEVVLDTTNIVQAYGDTLRWAQVPEEWAARQLENVKTWNTYYLVRQISDTKVLVRPKELDGYEECRAALSGDPEALFGSCDPEGCEGILRPKRKQP